MKAYHNDESIKKSAAESAWSAAELAQSIVWQAESAEAVVKVLKEEF